MRYGQCPYPRIPAPLAALLKRHAGTGCGILLGVAVTIPRWGAEAHRDTQRHKDTYREKHEDTQTHGDTQTETQGDTDRQQAADTDDTTVAARDTDEVLLYIYLIIYIRSHGASPPPRGKHAPNRLLHE